MPPSIRMMARLANTLIVLGLAGVILAAKLRLRGERWMIWAIELELAGAGMVMTVILMYQDWRSDKEHSRGFEPKPLNSEQTIGSRAGGDDSAGERDDSDGTTAQRRA